MEGNLFITAFWGAFCAFLFIKLSEYLSNNFTTVNNNRDSLLRMQQVLNIHLDEIYSNIFELDRMIKDFTKMDKTPIITHNKANTIKYDLSLIKDIINQDLLNEYFSYCMKLRKYNNDIMNINNLYNIFLNGLLQKTIDSDNFISNLKIMIKSLERIRNKLSEYDKIALRLISFNRLRVQKDNIGFFKNLVLFTIHKHNEKDFDKELIIEIKEVEKEREIIKKK